MATISYDGHSFILDGKRIWLVSGTMHFARIPSELWRDRIRTAKQAGLNCIETAACWNIHEPEPGEFNFEGDADIRAFIQTLSEEGMYCILRPGPYVGDAWDMGGLPAWLLENEDIKLRQGNPPFVQAAAGYLDRLIGEVANLQVTEDEPGPIVLMQNEHEWFCNNDEQGENYLQQLNRFLRESGAAVPLINRNEGWQRVSGVIDTWSGDDDIFSNCRQLRDFQRNTPSIVSSLPTGNLNIWGHDSESQRSPADVMFSMASVAATGSMFNLDAMCGGTNLGFLGGRLSGGDDQFVTTSHDSHAPITETGATTEKYFAVKRLATFLSQYAHVMANLTPAEHHTVGAADISITQQSGSMGKVVFLTRRETKSRTLEVIIPDGRYLPVDMGTDPVAWIALDVNLDGKGTLDLTNLRPWAFVEQKLLVFYGPAGSEAIISIDGTQFFDNVPTGKEPLVFQHEGMIVAVLNESQVDAARITDDGVYVGVAGLDTDGEPLAHDKFSTCYHISITGEKTRHRRKTETAPATPRLGKWEYAGVDRYVNGTAPRYAILGEPRSLERCGSDLGYGWYCVGMDRSRTKKASLLMPQAGDRLHMYIDGKLKSIVGDGPGASRKPLSLNLPSGASHLVFLADNFGRFSGQTGLDRPKGLYGPLFDVKVAKLSKPKITEELRTELFELSEYIPYCSTDERDPFARYTYEVKLAAKAPLVLQISGQRQRSVIFVNGKPVGLDLGEEVTEYFVLEEHLKKGVNRIAIALIDHLDTDPKEYDPTDSLTLYKVNETLTDKADWWYAKWEMPEPDFFDELPSSIPAQPGFFRTTFSVESNDQPLMLEINGASKGQIYLNGRNIGRYFVATHTGKAVPPQTQYYLPEPWLNVEEENELILFDEHGKSPSRCKLLYAE